jgi:hypothetical protein
MDYADFLLIMMPHVEPATQPVGGFMMFFEE